MASVARYKIVPSMNQEQDDGLYQSLDEDLVLSGLTNETNSTKRASILEALRNSVRRSGGRLQMQERFSLFNAIHNVLLDNDVNTRLACLNFICEVIPDFGNDLDDCMGLILPQLVVFIGHNQVSLKKLAVQTLHVYMKHSEHLENILNTIIQLGLQSENVDTQTESLIALPILITPNFAGEDLFLLTEALVRRIAGNWTRTTYEDSSIADTTSLAMISLDRIRTVVGKRNFEEYIQRLSPALQNVLANAMKGGESGEKLKTRKAKSATGVPLEDHLQTTKANKTKLGRSSTIPALGNESLNSRNIEKEPYLPPGILRKLKDSDWHLKMQGIEELRGWFEKDMTPNQFAPHLDSFFGILKDLLNDPNFKVNLTSLQLVGTMIDKLGTRVLTILEMLVSVLANKLGDNKNVMKQTNMQVFKKLMQNLSPKEVVSMLKPYVKHRNSRVREETLNVIIAALLTFPSNEFDLPRITDDVAPALVDTKRRVRHAALEAFAVISQAMGPGNLQPLVSTVDGIELQIGGDGVMGAVQARFARRQLPKLNSDGLVEYALPFPTAGSAKVSPNLAPRGADVEWVLAGGSSADCPSSARSTPGLSDSATGASPRRHFSAGKNRLPWENGEKPVAENVPPKVKNLWGVEDRQTSFKGNKSLKDGLSNDPIQSSYSEKYYTRKLSTLNNTDVAQSSNFVSSYAQQHKLKTKSAGLLSTKSIKGTGLGPLNNKTNGYSLIYKKGSLSGRASYDNGKSIDVNNNPNKPLTKSISLGVKSISHYDSGIEKSPAEKNQQNLIGLNSSMGASLPDWPSRPRKLLSPVSPSSNHDEDALNLNHDRHFSYDSPIPTKPALVGSASKKGRTMKSIDFSDTGSSPRISDASSPTQLSPVPPREHVYDAQRYKSRHATSRSRASPDYEGSNGRRHRSTFGNNTWSQGSRENNVRNNDSVPFDKKPRIARTPVQQHLKRRLSLEFANDLTTSGIVTTNTTQSMNKNVDSRMPPRKISQTKTVDKHAEVDSASDESTTEGKQMEVVGRAFDTTPEKPKNQTMQSTLNSTSGIGSSLEESGEIGLLKNGKIGMINHSLSDEKDDSATVEDIDDYEFEYEEDTESGEEDSGETSTTEPKGAKLLQEYQQHVDKLDQAEVSSESMYDGSDGESLEDSDGYEDDDEDGGFSQGRSSTEDKKNQRQSLSKSTRERMERKRLEEEERRSRARQRIEEVERQNQQQLESKEQSFRDKLAKEQLEIETLIKRKERERELEKLKQEKLQRQLEKKEDALREDFRRSKSYIDEIEKAKEVQREKERAEKLKRLQQKREKDVNEVRGIMMNDMDVDSKEDLAIHGHHAPSRAAEVVTKPPLSSSSKKKLASHPNHQAHKKDTDDTEKTAPKRNQLMSASSTSSLPTWEIPASDLKPFSNGEAAIKTTLKQLEGGEWESKCKALLCIRRLIRHHAHDVVAQLHVVIQALIAEVKNLRSQVSRAAIFTLGDMFSCLERHMDLDLDLTTKVLLKKAGESSGFIRDDVERTLGCLVSSVTSSKAINALVSGSSGHRNVHVRKTAAQFLCMLAERMGPSRCLSGSKDVTETILVATAAFASDCGAETRYYGRRILHMLHNHEDFERMLSKYLPSKSLNPTLTIVESLRTKGLGDIPGDSSSARARKLPTSGNVASRSSSIVSSTTDGAPPSSVVSNVASPNSVTSREGSRKHVRRISHEATSPQDQEDLANLAQQFTSNDWKERMQATDKLVYLSETRLSFVTSNFVKILDGFNPRLTDNNSKVNLHALQSLHAIIPILKENLNSSITTLVPSVAKNLASKNNNIVMVAEDVLDSFIQHIDNARILQPLCQFISVAPGGLRSRSSAVTTLLAVITDVYPRKPTNVIKHGLPVLWTLLGSASSASTAPGNTKRAVTSLSELLYSLMGDSLFEHASAKSQRIAQKLREIVNE